jgi:hypothetical protein
MKYKPWFLLSFQEFPDKEETVENNEKMRKENV